MKIISTIISFKLYARTYTSQCSAFLYSIVHQLYFTLFLLSSLVGSQDKHFYWLNTIDCSSIISEPLSLYKVVSMYPSKLFCLLLCLLCYTQLNIGMFYLEPRVVIELGYVALFIINVCRFSNVFPFNTSNWVLSFRPGFDQDICLFSRRLHF